MGSLSNFCDSLLKESPDHIELDKKNVLKWHKNNTIAFGYVKNKLYTGKSHIDIAVAHFDFNPEEYDYVVKELFTLSGRVFIDHKIISFWEDVDEYEVKKVIEGLRKKGIDINEYWYIDPWIHEEAIGKEPIPISDYFMYQRKELDAADIKAEKELHMISPILKTKMGKTKPYSKTMPIEYRYLIRGESELLTQTNSLLEREFDMMLNPYENEFGEKDTVFIYINPNIKEFHKARAAGGGAVRAYLMHNGDLFLWRADVLHMDVMPQITKKIHVDFSDYHKNFKNGVPLILLPDTDYFRVEGHPPRKGKLYQKILSWFSKGRKKSKLGFDFAF